MPPTRFVRRQFGEVATKITSEDLENADVRRKFTPGFIGELTRLAQMHVFCDRN
jgi:hypothetical protein